MAYITESMLLDYAQDIQKRQQARSNIVLEKASAQKTIFLSHSHKDKDLVEGLINYLASFGIKIYVDWNDTGMPRITNRDTAERIKEKIKENSFFLILATENAMSSRWVPWEIGVADQMKHENIAIIPVVRNSDSEFKGNEYLQLYRCIKIESQDNVKIFEVASVYRSMSIKDWLSR
jgi:hypothetical protein